jgi:hypothetical protein
MKLATVLVVVGFVMAGCSSQTPAQPDSATAAASASGLGQISAQNAAKPGGGPVTGSVIVSDQNDCTIGPTNVNQLQAGQTAYVWLNTNSVSVQDLTYEIIGTSAKNKTFDTGILKIRFNQCKAGFVSDLWAAFTTPTVTGGFQLIVFDANGVKINSDNFSIK